eukprot:TRINITY_DN776_c0_g1_i1.p1 TRINITY_DN776_c0_g1~~TRINITY_DN776_c0_g1_i1.p1  ORF type:complete len:159 (+),score=41.05 TRINITY_DN776_c0_g1_i1:51-527(+)
MTDSNKKDETKEEPKKKLKIYFCGSIRGESPNLQWYKAIVAHLKKYGPVLTEHVADDHSEEKHLTDRQIYERDMGWLRSSDCLVAECTSTSIGVGYELGQGHALKKPILCIYNSKHQPKKRLSAMIAGCPDIESVVVQTQDEALSAMDKFLAKIKPSS